MNKFVRVVVASSSWIDQYGRKTPQRPAKVVAFQAEDALDKRSPKS
jgi:hypothetical protein